MIDVDTSLSVWDIVAIVAYFIVIMFAGIYPSLNSSRGTVSGYFLAGRSANWILTGCSIFSSDIGSAHFVGVAGTAAVAGIAVSGFDLNAIIVLVILGWLFVPVYIASGQMFLVITGTTENLESHKIQSSLDHWVLWEKNEVYTMPEYLKQRFGGRRIQLYLSCLVLLIYVTIKTSSDLFAGAIFINQSIKISLYPAIGILLLVSAVYTTIGGLTAVIWADTVQTVIMLAGSITLMVISFVDIGGYDNMVSKYMSSVPSPNVTLQNYSNCAGYPRPDSMSLLRSADPDVGDLPWTGMTFGLTVSAVWYFCTDQVLVQRVLAAKNFSHAKGGCLFAGLLKILPLFLLVFPGMIARIKYTDEIACTDPDVCDKVCGSRIGCSNIAYPLLVMRLLPKGLRGVMLACMLSALMSSITAVYNSASTIFTMDIWKLIRKNASEVEQLIVGKLFVIVIVVVSILWIPIINAFPSSQLFNYTQSVTSYLAPPVCAVYVAAIFIPRVNEPGAFWALMSGLVIGMARFILEISYSAPLCNEDDNRPFIISKINYLNFGLFLFLVSFLICVVISLLTAPIPKESLIRLTFQTRNSKLERVSLEKQETGEHRDAVEEPLRTGIKKVIFTVCGLEKQKTRERTTSEIEKMQAEHISLSEKRRWKIFLDVVAVLNIGLMGFLYVYYR